MVEIVLDSMVRVPRGALSVRQMRMIRKELRLRKPTYGDAPAEIVNAYYEENGHVCLPRQWSGTRRLLKRNPYTDNRSAGSPVNLKFHSEKGWRRGQEEFHEDSVEGLREDGMGIMARAGCGFGKTVLGCAVSASMGVTTLVTVHTERIMEQWVESVRTFLGVEPGIIQGPRCEFEGRQIVIAMIWSLMNPEKYPEELFRWPGLLIIDEAHHTPATQFLNAIRRFPAKYYYGLTATPRRLDKLENLFFWTIGDIAADGEGDELPCRVERLIYEPDIPWEEIKDWRGKVSYSKFLKRLSEDQRRNAVWKRVLTSAARKGRRVIAITKYLDHIEELMGTVRGELGAEKTVEHLCSGKTKKHRAQQARARESDICFATDRIAKEGLDIEDLDVLALLLPMEDMEQAAGRIRRLMSGKRTPVIVDMQDNHPLVGRLNNVRFRYYRDEGWEINTRRAK